jgi:hypothetical protein
LDTPAIAQTSSMVSSAFMVFLSYFFALLKLSFFILNDQIRTPEHYCYKCSQEHKQQGLQG